MAKRGVCCAAQAAGDLGKPLIVNVHHKDGHVTQSCGTCEVQPSCRDPQKLVFSFKFIPNAACALPGASCKPTAQGIAQYNAERQAALTTGQLPYLEAHNGTVSFTPHPPAGRPYTLPLS